MSCFLAVFDSKDRNNTIAYKPPPLIEPVRGSSEEKKIVKVLTCQKAPSDAQTDTLSLTSGPLGETLHYCNGALRENLNAPNGFDSRRASPEVGDAHMRSACLGGLSTLVSCC